MSGKYEIRQPIGDGKSKLIQDFHSLEIAQAYLSGYNRAGVDRKLDAFIQYPAEAIDDRNLDLFEAGPEPIRKRPKKCHECNGHGADPLSDNVNWLPCKKCGGRGVLA